MIQTDEVELFELFQAIILANAASMKADATANTASTFSRAPDAINDSTMRLSDLGGGPGLLAAIAAQMDANGDTRLAAATRQCARALEDDALLLRARDNHRLLGYVYPVV